MYSACREPTHRSLITECCRFPGVGPGVKHLPNERASRRKPSRERKSISDSEAVGHTDSLNARGEDVRRFDMRRKPLRSENPAALADGSVKRLLYGEGTAGSFSPRIRRRRAVSRPPTPRTPRTPDTSYGSSREPRPSRSKHSPSRAGGLWRRPQRPSSAHRSSSRCRSLRRSGRP